MKKFLGILFTSLLVLLCVNGYAQDTTYYDDSSTKVTDKSLAASYEIVEYKGNSDTATVRTYFMSGKIESEINYSSYSQKIKHGQTIWWNEDGQVIFEAKYKEGKLDGERKISGKPESEINKTRNDSTYTGDPIFTVVEEMPQFPGGESALYKYLARNIKYPKNARRKGIEGTVYIKFIVDSEGNVKDVRIMKGASPELDEEATKVVKLMPKWKPGYQNKKAVNVFYTLPIVFKLT